MGGKTSLHPSVTCSIGKRVLMALLGCNGHGAHGGWGGQTQRFPRLQGGQRCRAVAGARSSQHRCLRGSHCSPSVSQVMLAASYWSLLAPAIDMAEESGSFGAFAFFPVAVGFALGAAFVYFADLLIPVLVSRCSWAGGLLLFLQLCRDRSQI